MWYKLMWIMIAGACGAFRRPDLECGVACIGPVCKVHFQGLGDLGCQFARRLVAMTDLNTVHIDFVTADHAAQLLL